MSMKIKFKEIYTYRVPMLKKKDVSEITGEATTIIIQSQLCKGCELCVYFCPEQILSMGNGLNTKSYHFPHVLPDKDADCKQCRYCERICPEMAIFLGEDEKKKV